MVMVERKQPEPPKTTWLDRTILAIAPAWGAKRIATRRLFEQAESNHSRFARIEAAEHNETRADRWLISRLSPDSQLEQDLETTRDRSRDIYQNDAMGGAVDGKVNHVIGTGHTPQARIKELEGVITAAEAETYNKQLESVYELWSKRADRNGRFSLWMLSRLAYAHFLFDGESFTVFSDVGRADKPIPLALQVIDPERVNTPSKFAGDKNVRLGIRYKSNGEIVGYYVQRAHPGDTKNVVGSLEYEFIEAERMLHVFTPWFAEQSRGLPWMTRALNRARDAKDYDEAAILGAQVEQCYAVFIKPAAGTGYASAVGAATSSNGNYRTQDIVPGSIYHVDPNEEVTSTAPQRPGNQFTPFMEWNYRRVAAAINWPYEMVIKNWGQLSFAAGRLVLNDAHKATQVDQQIMREMWHERVWDRMVYECVTLGECDIAPRIYVQQPHVFQRHVWIPPQWGYALNPGEEVDADIKSIDANLATLEDMLGKRGYDLEELVERRKREKQLIKDAGLEPPPKAGAASPVAAEPEDKESDEPAGVAA